MNELEPNVSCTKISTKIQVGPLWLEPGVTRGHCYGLFFASFFTIGILTLISLATNYVISVNLGIGFEQRGTVTGDLAFWTEITQIVLFAVVGVLADRIGRRPIYVAGMLIFALGYLLYPFADSLQQLTIYRIIYAAGLALSAGMLATVVADYPDDASRGKMVAVVGMLNGLGVVVLNTVFGRLPAWFVSFGVEPLWAGRYAHFVIVALCLLVAVVLRFTLQPGVPQGLEKAKPLVELARAGFMQGRNPRIALAYASAFVARSDLVILGTFLVTWGMMAGEKMGLSSADATLKATTIFVITQISALLWAPVAGFMMDRINRITGLTLFMLVSALGFGATSFIDNPLETAAIPFFILLGVAQISAFLGSQILIGQEAPVAERGSVVGMFNVFGAIGILITTAIGGRLFDQIAPWAPFVLVATMNIVLVVAGLIVRWRAAGLVPMVEQRFWQRLCLRNVPVADQAVDHHTKQ